MLEVRLSASRVRGNGMSVGRLGSSVKGTHTTFSRCNRPVPGLQFLFRPALISHQSRPCSPAFALSQQRLGIFRRGGPEFAETAINKSTPPYAARNTFRIRTYKKMGVGVASPSLRENFRSNTKQCIINTYAKSTAKYPRMCTYEKSAGVGIC